MTTQSKSSCSEKNIIDEMNKEDIELCNFCGESLEFYDNVARCACSDGRRQHDQSEKLQ